MAKLIKAFLHVAIKAPGLEAFKEACNFYENVLGLEPLSHWGEGLDTYQMYDFGNGGTIELRRRSRRRNGIHPSLCT